MPEERHGWQHAVAGCAAGVVSVLALHPLDVVKTRLQVQDGLKGNLTLYRGTRDAIRCMVREEGWRSLYAGLSPALLGAGLSWGIYFTTYNRAKARYKRWTRKEKLTAPLNLLSAAEAGVVVCCLTNPVWVVKTRLQLQRGGGLGVPAQLRRAKPVADAYSGFVHAVTRIAQEEGVRGFYKGLGPSLLLVSHGAIQFMVYEEMKSLARRWRARRGQAAELSAPEISTMGAASKLVASVATYPSQVVRSRMQQRLQGQRAVTYRSGMHVLQNTLQREGLAGLYKGLLPNVLRVTPASAITFLVYERVIKWLDNEEQRKVTFL